MAKRSYKDTEAESEDCFPLWTQQGFGLCKTASAVGAIVLCLIHTVAKQRQPHLQTSTVYPFL